MPVKVRCPECEKVLNAPDSARGKKVRCPKCQTVVRIPTGKKKKPKPTAPVDSEDFLSTFDMSKAEDTSVRLCPKCKTELDPEETECHRCGTDLKTGQLTAKARKKKAIKGPDPALFYKEAWKDCWQFLMKHKSLALRTGIFWTVFTLLFTGCGYMSFVFCDRTPPKAFWGFLTLAFGLGAPGWYWFLSILIIQATVDRNLKKLQRVTFDIFQNIALGLKAIIWPVVLMLPFVVIIAAAGAAQGAFSDLQNANNIGDVFDSMYVVLIVAVIVISYTVLPLAMVHMSMPYTYKAWILWDMVVVFFRNIGPAMFWWALALSVFLPVLAVLGLFIWLMLYFMGGASEAAVMGKLGAVTAWLISTIGETATEGTFTYSIIRGFLATVFFTLLIAPVTFSLAYPAVFMMRANGLLAYYNKRTMDLVGQQKPDVPVGFWVRYLSLVIDICLIPLTPVLVMKEKTTTMLAWFLIAICVLLFLPFSPIVGETRLMVIGAMSLYYPWMYFAVSEGTFDQATMGKQAFGVLIKSADGKQVTIAQATKRFFVKLVSILLAGAGCLMLLKDEKKRTLHDKAAKTLVVWKGDLD